MAVAPRELLRRFRSGNEADKAPSSRAALTPATARSTTTVKAAAPVDKAAVTKTDLTKTDLTKTAVTRTAAKKAPTKKAPAKKAPAKQVATGTALSNEASPARKSANHATVGRPGGQSSRQSRARRARG